MSGLGLNPIKLIVWITSLEWTQDMDWLLKLFSRLPLRFLQVVGAGIGGLTFKLSPATRARAMENLKLAGYDDPHLYERVGRNAGRQAGPGH